MCYVLLCLTPYLVDHRMMSILNEDLLVYFKNLFLFSSKICLSFFMYLLLMLLKPPYYFHKDLRL